MSRMCLSPGKIDRRSSNGLHLTMTSTDLNPRSSGVGAVDFAATVGDGGGQISTARPPVTMEEAPPLKDEPLRPTRAMRLSSSDSILSIDPTIGLSSDDSAEDSKSHVTPIKLFRVDSAEWVNDFKNEPLLHNMSPNIFDQKEDSDRKLLGLGARQPQVYDAPLHEKAPPIEEDIESSFKEQQQDCGEEKNSTTTSSSLTAKKPSKKNPSKEGPSKKKRSERIIDKGVVCVPTDKDVVFGRGGFGNKHPGNKEFREQASKLRRVYEKSTKEEKYKISKTLVEFVTSEGGRFLEMGKDKKWHPVISYDGIRRKASQALREEASPKTSRKTNGKSAVVKKNADIVFGEGSSLEKDMLQLRTTTTAEEMEEEKEMAFVLAESEREHLNNLSPREREDHIEQEWMINGAHLSSRVRGMTPEEAAIANSVREFAATEANRKQMASLGLALSHMPEERVRQFKDYHYMLEVRKQFKRSEEAEDTL